jgi:hypothetical protein
VGPSTKVGFGLGAEIPPFIARFRSRSESGPGTRPSGKLSPQRESRHRVEGSVTASSAT